MSGRRGGNNQNSGCCSGIHGRGRGHGQKCWQDFQPPSTSNNSQLYWHYHFNQEMLVRSPPNNFTFTKSHESKTSEKYQMLVFYTIFQESNLRHHEAPRHRQQPEGTRTGTPALLPSPKETSSRTRSRWRRSSNSSSLQPKKNPSLLKRWRSVLTMRKRPFFLACKRSRRLQLEHPPSSELQKKSEWKGREASHIKDWATLQTSTRQSNNFETSQGVSMPWSTQIAWCQSI